jgi:hypothetical protein
MVSFDGGVKNQKGDVQANLLNENWCKNHQENGKLNPTTYKKDHTTRPSWLHPRDAGMV